VRESHYPETLYLVVSLSPSERDQITGEPGLRAWRIVEDTVHEVEIGIDD
jgi:hypothetical protein